MNCKILVLTHGNLARELVETVELVMGKTEGLCYRTLPVDADLSAYAADLEQLVKENCDEGILILTDILGGSPFLQSMKIMGQHLHKDVELVTGVNLPMLLEAAGQTGLEVSELKAAMIRAGREGISDIRMKLEGKV